MEKEQIDVGPIQNEEDAQQKADLWLQRNPGYAWNGEWSHSKDGKTGFIVVYKQPMVRNSFNFHQPAHTLSDIEAHIPLKSDDFINEIVSDDEQGGNSKADISQQEISVEKFLMQIPPDFDKAEKHGVRKNK